MTLSPEPCVPGARPYGTRAVRGLCLSGCALLVPGAAACWLEIPARWDEEEWRDIDGWARRAVRGGRWRERGTRRQDAAATLRSCAGAFAPERFDHRVFLHLETPGRRAGEAALPLPVSIEVTPADGEMSAALRARVGAQDPEAVEEPVVEAHRCPGLGEGLRALRYLCGDAEDPRVVAALRYAWRDHAHGADVTLATASHDIGRLLRTVGPIERLAGRLTLERLP